MMDYEHWNEICRKDRADAREDRELISRLTAEREGLAHDIERHVEIAASLTADNERLRKALEFYADPFAWKKLHDPHNDVQVPDFYSETSFGDTATAALATSAETDADGGGFSKC